nr:MAG TPA_asm: distal tail protein [Caudoviricetes sp.]
MTEMTVNNIDISNYSARLLSYSVSGTTLTNNVSANTNLVKMPAMYSTEYGTRTLTVTLTFSPHLDGCSAKGTDITDRYAAATDNISRFEADIIGKKVEISLPDGYMYSSIVTSVSAAAFDGSGEHDVTYTFMAVRHKPTITATVAPNGKIYCQSTVPCKFRLTVTLPEQSSLITICGIVVINIAANTPLVIDGELGLITLGGVNKFLDSTLIDFPLLYPGENTIKCNNSKADIQITYTPIYV